MGVDLMSDNWNFLLVVTEGPHDIATITRVLRLRGYKELENENDVPDHLRANQVSIHDDKWITQETVKNVELHTHFADFLDSVISLLDKAG